MTDLTEETARLLAMREGMTPGKWGFETVTTSCGVCHKIGPWPHQWRHGNNMSACIYDDYPSPPQGTGAMLSNARAIAAVPDMLAHIEAQASEIAAMTTRADAALALVERAFKDGMSYANNVNVLDPAERQKAWEWSQARAALAEVPPHA